MFADTVVVDPMASWPAAFAAMAIAVTSITTLIYQLIARSDLAKKNKKDDDLAAAKAKKEEELIEAGKKAIAEADRKAELAAKKVEEVKVNLEKSNAGSDRKLDEIVKVTAVIHKLTNSQHGASLRLTSDLSDWKANQTHDPVDIEAARVAKKLSVAHEIEQAKIHAKETGSPTI